MNRKEKDGSHKSARWRREGRERGGRGAVCHLDNCNPDSIHDLPPVRDIKQKNTEGLI